MYVEYNNIIEYNCHTTNFGENESKSGNNI